VKCTNPIPIEVSGYGVFDVPCGKCLGCRIARTQEWSLRIWHELSSFEHVGNFTTLTYDDESNPGGSLVKEDLQKFLKRLRKALDGRKIKYFACGEYGDNTFRPHYHLILLGVDFFGEDVKKVKCCWPFGFVKVYPLNQTRINYVTKYITKKLFGREATKEVYGENLPPFQLQSQGLGLRFALENEEQIRRNLLVTMYGKKAGLPRYYRKKLQIRASEFAEKQKEKQDELYEYFEKKGKTSVVRKKVGRSVYEVKDGFNRAVWEARKQAEKAYKARLNMHKKGFL
jgi:hypothetical protein